MLGTSHPSSRHHADATGSKSGSSPRAWHFQLKQSDRSDQLLTATFQNAGDITVAADEISGNVTLDYDMYTTGADILLATSTSSGTGVLVLKDIFTNPPRSDPGLRSRSSALVSTEFARQSRHGDNASPTNSLARVAECPTAPCALP
jgi:hypothetical protein